ncbi:hypothetical protein LOB94_00650 [Lactobacillus delbrueckii subsp. bulgaricus]|uniref:hypothetical protein n=1 Tax=Lactobacillus delbrueckii TaxID=1584 RepID=UPI001E507E86|nr:hypothetical protein [Lactobacillus delbrueckii]MCD5466313.1 hypothetical protein [Lactobacillus delbrueckii subsp. bulgaricus]MCD5481892.1 hypothetical protein [Lactobacillus delbrueckii subsp. bulgaricus]
MIDVLTSYNANQVYQDQARDDLGVTVNFSLSADQYRDMPLPFIIAAPVYQEKRVVDMQYIYVNQAYAEIMGQSRAGRSCWATECRILSSTSWLSGLR